MCLNMLKIFHLDLYYRVTLTYRVDHGEGKPVGFLTLIIVTYLPYLREIAHLVFELETVRQT